MKAGTVNIARNIWDDPAFKDQPFTEREAFIWLVMEAAWKPRERRLNDTVVHLERGQVLASIRFMAEAWSWKKSTVQRFIERLKKRDMIATKTGTAATVITIRKYNEYQFDPRDSGTAAGQQRDTRGTAAGHARDKREEIKTMKDDERNSLPSGERARELDQSPLEAECDDNDDAAAGASDHDAKAPTPTDQGGADGGGGRSAGSGRKGGAGDGAAHRKPAAKPAKQRRQFPEDWWPSPKGCAYAEQRGCPDLAENVAACIDYHRSHGNTWLDLEATWRTWCRNAGKYGWATASGGNAHAQAAAHGGVRGGYVAAGDRSRETADRMFAASSNIVARREGGNGFGSTGTGSSAVPVVDLAEWRSGGSGGR